MDKELQDLQLLLKATDDDEDEDEKEPKDLDLEIDTSDEDEDEEEKEMRGKGKGKKMKDDDEYDAKYIAKYLKRYAKENEEDFEKFCSSIGKLKKAYDEAADIDYNDDEVNGVLIDGTQVFKAFKDYIDYTSEVLKDMQKQINDISQIVASNAAITKASSSVIIKAMEQSQNSPINTFKAVTSANVKGKNEAMSDISAIKKALYKAAMNGDSRAFTEMTRLESCYGNLSLLGENSIKYISKIMEAK
jgi:hypothetical protein